jgi:hypothetical protein
MSLLSLSVSDLIRYFTYAVISECYRESLQNCQIVLTRWGLTLGSVTKS